MGKKRTLCRKGRTPPSSRALQPVRFRKLRGRNPEEPRLILPAVRGGERGCSTPELRSCAAHQASARQIPNPPKSFAPMPCGTPRRGGPLGTNSRNSTRKLFSRSHHGSVTRSRDDREAVPSLAQR